MGKVWVIADLHLGHEKMAMYRGFSSADEQDRLIEERWNSVVGKRDTVWILGDVSMEKRSHYYKLGRLNGFKKVVLGNHDMSKGSHNHEMLKWVNSIAGVVTDRDRRWILTHVPVHPTELSRWGLNIHGHLHGESIEESGWICVSCEQVYYTPVQLKDLLKSFYNTED